MRLTRIHHVTFAVPDLARTVAFAQDFGLLPVESNETHLVMRTAGGDSFSYLAVRAEQPRFIGFAFEVASSAVLDEAVARFGATARAPLDTPGGGEGVTLTDPNGFTVSLIHGVASHQPGGAVADLRHNTPSSRLRYGDTQHQRALGPATLFRLGHIGLFVRDFAESAAWYERTLGLIGSDIYHVPHDPDHKIVGFFRLNRGEEWVDHHTVALMQRTEAPPDCHHISFEAQDFEAQFMAHRWLQSREHEPVWGVGRHPHGSHVFDVWRSPDRVRFETFSDTDLLNESGGTRIHNIKDVQMDVWSSDPPDRYFA